METKYISEPNQKEIVKRATNYSKMEWLVNTHRKIAIESRQQLLRAVQEELQEEMGMKQKGTQIVRQRYESTAAYYLVHFSSFLLQSCIQLARSCPSSYNG